MVNTKFDVIIVGCGHAGAEAALAAARMGVDVAIFCLDFSKAASMPCNPSIGGSAKGQIVGEIDAMGGVMGEAADNTFLQIKYLNRSRGPAVHALRTQNDKYQYPKYVQNKIKSYPNISIFDDEVSALVKSENTVVGCLTSSGKTFYSSAIVITTGTYLKGITHIGLNNKPEGRMDEPPSNDLSTNLKDLGFKLGRLKTGTTPRICSKTMDVSKMSVQPGDEGFLHFSFRTKSKTNHDNQINCYLTNTNKTVHDIIRNNLHESPMYSGIIEGVGPRYCPSLEDKVVRFEEKTSHHLFVEPESTSTTEIYIQGFNTSLPESVQRQILNNIPGLEQSKILKPGYAVEYDFVFPDQLFPTLQSKKYSTLLFAGQINGTSGYEEAAAQGLIAGMNAANVALGRPTQIVSRETSYIGTLIDDLTSKNVIDEPYRMMTARSEYRLLFRQDNAIFRLSEFAFSQGLLNSDDFQIIRGLINDRERCIKYCRKHTISDNLAKKYEASKTKLFEFIKRPEVSFLDIYSDISSFFNQETVERAIIEIRYEGYIKRQEKQVLKLSRFDSISIPSDLNYSSILGLREESRVKLSTLRPKTILEAKKIAGINPADLMILLSHVRS